MTLLKSQYKLLNIKYVRHRYVSIPVVINVILAKTRLYDWYSAAANGNLLNYCSYRSELKGALFPASPCTLYSMRSCLVKLSRGVSINPWLKSFHQPLAAPLSRKIPLPKSSEPGFSITLEGESIVYLLSPALLPLCYHAIQSHVPPSPPPPFYTAMSLGSLPPPTTILKSPVGAMGPGSSCTYNYLWTSD